MTRSPVQECGEAAPEAGAGAVQEAGGRGWRRGSPSWDWELGRSPRLGQEEASTGEEEEAEQRASRSVDNIDSTLVYRYVEICSVLEVRDF